MAELADEWPSLAPIRTSCRSSSSSYYFYEPTTTHSHNSIPSSSCSSPLSLPPLKAADHYNYPYSFQSPPSSSSHASFLHSATSLNHKNQSFLSKCFAPARHSHGFPKQCISASPGRDIRRHVGSGNFQSVTSFPGPGSRAGSSAICGVAAGNSALSRPLKSGYSNACKGHLATMNAFTMIPVNVVGKKKPLDYLSDEPTSPEVTCIGSVRRSKHSKSTWDALLNSSEKLYKKRKAPRKQIEFTSARRNVAQDLQLAYIPRPLSSAPSTKWKRMVSLFKDIKGLHSPYLQRKLRQDDLVIDLSQLRAACGATDRFTSKRDIHYAGNEILYICQAGEGEEDRSISQEEGRKDLNHAEAPLVHPNCLLLMRNMSGRSKVFHSQDDNSRADEGGADPLAVKAISPPAAECQVQWNKKQAFSLWKSKKLIFPRKAKS